MRDVAFEVVIRGRVGVELAGAMDGFAVSDAADGLTTIVGHGVDQSRLMSLLGVLDDLHVDIVGVTTSALSPAEGDAAASDDS